MSIIYALVEPTECKGIPILTINLLLVISIVFVFLGHPGIKHALTIYGTGYRVQGTELVLRHSNSNNTLFQ